MIVHVVRYIFPAYSFQRPTERVAQSSQSSDSTDHSGYSLQPSTENNTPLVAARPNVRMFLTPINILSIPYIFEKCMANEI